MLDDAAPADVADQQLLARPQPDDQLPQQAADMLEADPADVADQRRDAPVLNQDEPWP